MNRIKILILFIILILFYSFSPLDLEYKNLEKNGRKIPIILNYNSLNVFNIDILYILLNPKGIDCLKTYEIKKILIEYIDFNEEKIESLRKRYNQYCLNELKYDYTKFEKRDPFYQYLEFYLLSTKIIMNSILVTNDNAKIQANPMLLGKNQIFPILLFYQEMKDVEDPLIEDIIKLKTEIIKLMDLNIISAKINYIFNTFYDLFKLNSILPKEKHQKFLSLKVSFGLFEDFYQTLSEFEESHIVLPILIKQKFNFFNIFAHELSHIIIHESNTLVMENVKAKDLLYDFLASSFIIPKNSYKNKIIKLLNDENYPRLMNRYEIYKKYDFNKIDLEEILVDIAAKIYYFNFYGEISSGVFSELSLLYDFNKYFFKNNFEYFQNPSSYFKDLDNLEYLIKEFFLQYKVTRLKELFKYNNIYLYKEF